MTLCKQKVKTFFLSTLIALNPKWVPRLTDLTFNNLTHLKHLITFFILILLHTASKIVTYDLRLTKLIIITIITTSRIYTKILVDFNVTVGASSKEYIAMYCSINQSLDRLWEIAWRMGSNTIISVSKVRRWSRSNRLMINIRIY